MVSYSSFVIPHNVLSCVSLALNFFNPLSHSFGPYLQTSHQWDCYDDGKAFQVSGTLLGHIPNQMGPTSQDICDSLETYTRCQLVIGMRFPPRHYYCRTIMSLICSRFLDRCVLLPITGLRVLGILRLMGWASISRSCNGLDLYIMLVQWTGPLYHARIGSNRET